jgi:hypothetical protein
MMMTKDMASFLLEARHQKREAARSNDMVNDVVLLCHAQAVSGGWWHNLKTGEPIERNVGECLALIHSEISEALEAHRKNLMDDKLSMRKGFEVELADAVIRIFDLAGAQGLDLGGALTEKLEYNLTRADHKPENRLAAGGKAY